jgi:predicted nucleic acid-binding protein
MDKAYVLDSFALLAHFEAEPGAERVRSLLRSAQAGKTSLFLSVINFGEIYYTTLRERGTKEAEEIRFFMAQLPIEILDADMELTLAAAKLKGRHSVAYADCFAAALGIRSRAKVVTGDPEFKKFGAVVAVEWLASNAGPG